ncbi:MAG: CRISPR-associated endonuclease Cas2 [Patescibacteria group bacterium]
MKGNITLKILEVIGEGLVTTADIITAILESGYGASASKMDRNYRRLEARRTKEILHREKMKSYYNLISKLNRDGFLIVKQKNWLLSALGKKKMEKLKKQMIERIPRKKYEVAKSNDLTIVSFDIPEKEKRKRNWLRDTLANLNFKMLQKSVWLGKNKIPGELLNDMRKLEILDYVHIFSVNRTGSIAER